MERRPFSGDRTPTVQKLAEKVRNIALASAQAIPGPHDPEDIAHKVWDVVSRDLEKKGIRVRSEKAFANLVRTRTGFVIAHEIRELTKPETHDILPWKLAGFREFVELDTGARGEVSDRVLAVQRELALLPETERMAFSLHVLHYSHREIGEMLEISEQHSKNLYSKALRTLRARLAHLRRPRRKS